MSRPVTYRIRRKLSGGFAVVVVISTDEIYVRDGLATFAEAEK